MPGRISSLTRIDGTGPPAGPPPYGPAEGAAEGASGAAAGGRFSSVFWQADAKSTVARTNISNLRIVSFSNLDCRRARGQTILRFAMPYSARRLNSVSLGRKAQEFLTPPCAVVRIASPGSGG